MKLRKIIALAAIPALLTLAATFAWWWLLNTEAGARWMFDKAAAATNHSLTARRISGNLNSGLQMDGLRFAATGFSADAEVLRVAINVNLLPVAVEIISLHADNIQLSITPDSQNNSQGEDAPGTFKMPFPLIFRDLELSDIEYLDGSGGPPVVVNSIEAAGSLDETLVLDRFSVSHPDIRLDLSGRAAFASPHALAVKFQTQGRIGLEGSLDGDLDSATLVLDLEDPLAHISGTVGQLLGVPVWDLEVNSSSLQIPPGGPNPVATLAGVQALISGKWPNFNLDLAADLEIRGLEAQQLALTGSGTINDFTARELTLRGHELSLDASGTVSWEDTLRLGMSATMERLDLRTWLPEWPEDHPLSGHFAVSWEGDNLAVNDFSLEVAGTSLSANGRGIVASDSGIVDVALNWENFAWPIGNPSPTVASKSGSLQIGGRLENWELKGTLDLQSGEYPPGRLQLSGAGNDESLNLTIQEGQVLGGVISGDVFWKWTGGQPFKATVTARQIDITPLFPDYPGVLNARLGLDGQVEPFHLAVDIQQLDGTVRERPVSAQGGLIIDPGRLIAKQLHLASGASTLNLDGSLYEPGGVDFAADIDSLAWFAEGYQGALAAQGNISLNLPSPRISVSLSGRDLVIGPVTIDRLETREPSGSGFEQGSEFIFSGLVVGQQHIDALSIGIGGDKPLERIAISARADGSEIALDLTGSVKDWADPAGSGWRGELSGLRIDHGDEFFLALDQPAAFEWAPGLFRLESACLGGTSGAHLCVASSRRGQDELTIAADLAAIPLGLIGMFVDTELKFSHILSGTLNWSQSAAAGRIGAAQFEISPGTITRASDDEMVIDTGSGQFGFELAGGTLQKGNLDLAIPETGEIDIDFNIPDFSLGAYSPVRGKVRVDIHDLSTLGPIMPVFDSLNGALNIDVILSGILVDPAFKGKISLTNGEIAIDSSGSTFSEINLSGDVSDMDRSELKGTFRAGEGAGTITTIIGFEDLLSPVVELTLKGESLTIIDVPQLNIIANPDFTLNWANGSLDINGRLFIPKARLAPSIIPRASTQQSADVVIVAGQLPVSVQDETPANPLRIRGTLEVELGEQATVELKMARVKVYGVTRFTWQDELLPQANGNFDIRGDIQAYGQTLKITQGRISFPDVPADNPHLNIRAERDIFGNSQIQKAGLMVAGTVRRPIIEPFTVPSTNKERAQTLLVTGSDFNFEQGVGAIAVGFYILPRLYISYGFGIFGEGNIFSVRYDLGRRFGVRVTSGQRDTGADLNYTIER